MAERGFQFVESSQSCAQTGSHTPCNEDSGRKRRSRQRVRKTEGPASMARDESQKQKKEVIQQAQQEGRTVHFATLMDLCHFKNSELEPKFQKHKGRVVLRGEVVKDDTGSYAVLTEQVSSASQMTAINVLDVISRLPGCAGRASDAVSTHAQGKMEDAPKLFKNFRNRNFPLNGFDHHVINGQNDGGKFKNQMFFSSAICMVTHQQDCSGEDSSKRS